MMQSYFSRSARRTAGLALLALGAGTLTAQAQATYNRGLQFNGSSKYGSTASAINLSGSALSMECWVRFSGFKTASPYISSIMGMEAAGGAALLRTGDISQDPNKLQFVVQVGTTQSKLNSTTPLATNTWYHVAATYDGSTMKLYLDGVQNATLTAVGSATANAVFTIGRNYEDARVLNGAIDEVRVWNRVLTPAEILANRCEVGANPTGLLGLWRLDEGSGTTAADGSGTAALHPLTLTAVTNADWITTTPAVCGRLGTTGSAAVSGLRVLPGQNPVAGATAEAEVRGAAGQPVLVQVLNAVGQVVASQQVRAAAAAERVTLALPPAAGLYVLRASTPGGVATAKLLRN